MLKKTNLPDYIHMPRRNAHNVVKSREMSASENTEHPLQGPHPTD